MPSKHQKDELHEELEMQVAALTEALQRERADAMNFRRRAEEEKLRMGNVHKAQLLKELLPAFDNLELALKHTPKDLKDHPYAKGVGSVTKQFNEALKSLGLEKIATVGEEFDPHLHEAVQIEDGEGDKEIIIEELQTGWKLGDEVIRHAIVKVGRQHGDS